MNDYNELIERCKEILEWKKTGLLNGDALREYANRQPYGSEYDKLAIAEAVTLKDAAEAFVELAARDATIKLQDERIAELEAERAEREKQEPIATVGWDRNFMGVVWHGKDMPEKGVETLLYAAPPVTEQGCVTVTTDESGRAVAVTRQDDEHRILSVIWEAPVTAPVRLTDRDKDGLAVPYSGMGGIEDYRAYAQDIEAAVLRANGFKVEK